MNVEYDYYKPFNSVLPTEGYVVYRTELFDVTKKSYTCPCCRDLHPLVNRKLGNTNQYLYVCLKTHKGYVCPPGQYESVTSLIDVADFELTEEDIYNISNEML